MKKTLTLLFAAAAMMLSAQTLTFQMGNDEGAAILNGGKFNAYGRFIGNTGENTAILVGQVDFGAGDVYKAVSIRFANGWSNGGKAILKAGLTLSAAEEFASMDLINFYDSYTNFRSIGANFSMAPTGLLNVYLTFESRAGNIMDVRFYNDEFTADSYENGSMLKEPCDLAGYTDMATVLNIDNSERVYPTDGDTPRIDNGSWGWTGEGVIVKYGDLDFGEGDYKQVVLELASHWQGDQVDHSVDVYIDDTDNEANLIANIWCGIDVKTKLYLARNIESITGNHTIYLKWHGGSCNIANVHFVKDYLYSVGNRIDTTPLNVEKCHEQPSDKAFRYSFRSGVADGDNVVNVGKNSDRTTILNNGQWEDNNVGYTADGSVLRVSGVDFKDGEFDKMLVNYATGNNDPSYPESNNFKFYIDLEDNAATGAGAPRRAIDWGKSRLELADVEPVATIWMQSSGGWGDEVTTIGDMSAVSGEHDLYIVYAGDGANIKDIYLDDQEEKITTGVETVKVTKTITDGNVYSIDGRLVKKGAGTVEGLQPGLYILNGRKVVVK